MDLTVWDVPRCHVCDSDEINVPLLFEGRSGLVSALRYLWSDLDDPQTRGFRSPGSIRSTSGCKLVDCPRHLYSAQAIRRVGSA
jgi:hypothetical protein